MKSLSPFTFIILFIAVCANGQQSSFDVKAERTKMDLITFVKITENIVGKDGFDGYLPSILEMDKRQIIVLENVPDISQGSHQKITEQWIKDLGYQNKEIFFAFMHDRNNIVLCHRKKDTNKCAKLVRGPDSIRIIEDVNYENLQMEKPILTFNGPSWTIELPADWSAQYDKECVTIVPPGKLGPLQISSARKRATVTDADLKQIMKRNRVTESETRPIEVGPYRGYYWTFDALDLHHRYWFLRYGTTILLVTYVCNIYDRELDDKIVDELMMSLRPIQPSEN
jgi:hypothetical protein